MLAYRSGYSRQTSLFLLLGSVTAGPRLAGLTVTRHLTPCQSWALSWLRSMRGDEELPGELPGDLTPEHCNVCEGIGLPLGRLGQRCHFCCRDCGAMFSQP